MKLEKIMPYVLVVLLGLSGCVITSNLNQISTLQGYSKEKDNQHRLVKSINDHYDALTSVIKQGHISEYKNKVSFVRYFGEPIWKKDLSDGTEQWLYRYAIFRLAKDKVYVYFDRNGKMIRWEKLPCSLSF